jgi:hypothetical protein
MAREKGESPHSAPADYNEGPTAAERFKNVIGHLANLAASAGPQPEPHLRKEMERKNK